MLPRRPHEIKIIEPLDDRRLYHGECKMILNENDSRAMPSSQFTVNKIKKMTLKHHIYIFYV
jgi:hypothetical protein